MSLDYALEETPEQKAHAKRLREGVRFDMRGGPWDGCMLRMFPSEWDVWAVPEFGGSYTRPRTVNPHMAKAAPNKKRDNVPRMVWSVET